MEDQHAVKSTALFHENISVKMDTEPTQLAELKKFLKGMTPKGLSDCPNQLSEKTSPQVDIQSNSEVLASENVFDPYIVLGKLSWPDIGNYGLATGVSWMSVGKKQLEYASGALRRFLVEQQ